MNQRESEIQLLETENSEDYKKLKALYQQSFPLYERLPLALWKKIETKFYSIYDHEEWIGFIMLLSNKELVYISYFAIDPKFQSKGYGGKVLEKIKSEYDGKRIFLAAEKAIEGTKNFEQRCKRNAFYERQGFVFSGYGMNMKSASMNLLIYGGNFEPRDLIDFIQECVGGSIGKLLQWQVKKFLKESTS